MKVTVVAPTELGPAERRRWEALSEDPPLRSPFLSWEFALAIGQVRDDARVAVVEDGVELCGFLAFQAGADHVGGPVGATIGDAQAFIGPAGWDFDPRLVVEAAGLSCWRFDHLVVSQAPFEPYHHHRHRSPVVDLHGGYDSFLEEVRAHSRDLLAQVGRRRRKLEREVGPVVCEWQSVRPDDDMALLQRWKSEQYTRTGVWDRFAQPWIAEALGALARTESRSCTGVLTVLRAGDRLAAAHFGLLGRDRLSWWFPAYDPDLGRYSPGLILLLDLITHAAERGVGMVDLGRGEHDYKLRFTSRHYEVAEGVVEAIAPPGPCRRSAPRPGP
jgi:CelD/BcsL family acetyltransferase involved in cellulose biosynthesis